MSGPSAFSVYASRFLSNKPDDADPQQIFRAASPSSPSHDPFVASPSTSRSHPHLSGSSRSPSPSRTPPFPGPGISAIPDIDEEHGLGMLFDPEEQSEYRASVPNPYAASSSSGEEIEPDLDRVQALRRPVSDRARKGWLSHQSVFPPSSASSATESDKETEDGSEGSPQTSLTEPLLHSDEPSRTKIPTRLHVYHGRFGHWQGEGLRKYKDSGYLALWLSSILAIIVGLCFVWGSTNPSASPRPRPSIIPLLPLLFVLLIPALLLPPVFLLLLRKTVRPVLLGTAVAVPLSLFVCGWWAFAASFERFDTPDAWWGTTGLRLCSLALWLVSGWFGRMVYVRRKRLEKTASVVELATSLLLSHPPLLLLTPLLLGVFALTSIPFLTLLIRLGTIGYWRHPKENTYVFHVRPYAGWLIFLVALIWVWTWGVIRGVGRVAVAGVIGEWYFHRQDSTHPAPLEVTQAAMHRATGTSLGSICLGAGIVAIVRIVGRSAAELRRLTSAKMLPSPLSFLSSLTPLFAVVAGVLDQLNGYALIYVGITGDAFWPSARRAVGLAGHRKAGHLLDYTLIKLLLTLSSTAMGLFTATAGYLYMSHSMGNPNYAPLAGLLCGGIPFLAIRAGAGVLGDAADALFICHQIDGEMGGEHSHEAKDAFGSQRSAMATV